MHVFVHFNWLLCGTGRKRNQGKINNRKLVHVAGQYGVDYIDPYSTLELLHVNRERSFRCVCVAYQSEWCIVAAEVVVAAHWVVSQSLHHLCQDVEGVRHLPHHQETQITQGKEGKFLYTSPDYTVN